MEKRKNLEDITDITEITSEDFEYSTSLAIREESNPDTLDQKGLAVKEDKKGLKKRKKEDKKEKTSKEFLGREEAFLSLANLLNVKIDQVYDECFLFQIRKIMGRLGKVIVRYNIKESELEKLLINAIELDMAEIAISPVYIPALKKRVNKLALHSQKVISFIDFPFGESLFKSKLNDVKESIKDGVDGVTVMLPTMLLDDANLKEFKKQVKKLGKIKTVEKGIALVATDISDAQVKHALKTVEKSGLDSLTFVFGDATEEDIMNKLTAIEKYKGKKTVKILGNVQTAEGTVEIFKLGADMVLTPYADEIGLELIKRFNVKTAKLR